MEPGARKAARRAKGQIAAGRVVLPKFTNPSHTSTATLCHRFPAKTWRGPLLAAPGGVREASASRKRLPPPQSGQWRFFRWAGVAALCPARKLRHYGCIGNNSGSSALGWNTDGRKRNMKIARINRHIARPVLASAKRLRIESKRRKFVYFLCAVGLEPLRYPYTS
jgi:hypothetical protein